jgi:hypothetical protein
MEAEMKKTRPEPSFWQKIKTFLLTPNKFHNVSNASKRSNNYDDDCAIDGSDCDRSAVSPSSVYGRTPKWCEFYENAIDTIKPGQTVKAVIDLDMRSMFFHVAVWREIVQPQHNWIIAPYFQEDQDDNWFRGVLLVEESVYDEVKQWFDEYSQRVGNIDVPRALPELIKGKSISGVPIMSNSEVHIRRNIHLPDMDLFEEWCWLTRNCTGKFIFFDRYFLIDDQTEALAFELSR